ncbi:homocysteine S-methyltransferase family protein [Microlunatus ginsengisoli]|uniref:Homocysteine S-methyltransferase family protein n=1 Tax=Microlunatus ginsengisoli TaxID=363863 RepID=A0ABP6ZQ18_9ACTN
MTNPTLPQLDGRPMVTDGGLETDLIFHQGVDLPEFAAFPLLDSDRGRSLLTDYYTGYAEIAAAADAGLMLEAPTWRASADWGEKLGYDRDGIRRVNSEAIGYLRELGRRYAGSVSDIVVCGTVGPRGDGYAAGSRMDPDQAADYHGWQLAAFAEAGAECAVAYTLTDQAEAIGIVRAARAVGLPIAVSFTVETDGRLPDGMPLAAAVDAVDAASPPDYFLVNCAHPSHLEPALDAPGAWRARVKGLRSNASRRSHAELDEAEQLDEGDPASFGAEHAAVRGALPELTVLGGCCGTDRRHVASLWGVG